MPKLWENPAIDVARCDKQTPYPTVLTMSYADKLPTPEQFNRDWQDTIRCDLRNDSPRFGELEFPERPIVLEDDDFILTPIAEQFVDRTFVWSADGSPVHVAHVLSAAAYYAAAPDRERFATVRKIGRAVRNLAGALAWGLSYRLQRFAEAVDRRQLADLS